MGVPEFFKWLKTKGNNNGIVNNVPKAGVRSLSIDLSSMIHEALQKYYLYGDFKMSEDDKDYKKRLELINKSTIKQNNENVFGILIDEILSLCRIYSGIRLLILASDGTPPLGKINQQRQRRYKSNKDKSSPYNTVNVTPGTDFMIFLDKRFKEWLSVNINSNPHLPKNVIYSSFFAKGEGEHKIMDYFRYIPLDEQDENIYKYMADSEDEFQKFQDEIRNDKIPLKNEYHIIYGLDTDLILLSCLLPQYESIFIVKHAEREKSIIDIGTFSKFLENKFEIKRHDFVLLMTLIGNDFIPNVPEFPELEKSMEYMMDKYSKYKKPLTINGYNIIWSNFLEFLKILSNNSNKLLDNIVRQKYKYPSKIYEASLQNDKFEYDVLRSLWYYREFGYDENYTSLDVTNMCLNYLNTIAWNLLYYVKGSDYINVDFIYEYYTAPFLDDLQFVASKIEGPYGYERENDEFMSLYEQLVSVIPPENRVNVNNSINKIINGNEYKEGGNVIYENSLIEYLLPKDFNILLSGVQILRDDFRDKQDKSFKSIALLSKIGKNERLWIKYVITKYYPEIDFLQEKEEDNIFSRTKEGDENIESKRKKILFVREIKRQQRNTEYVKKNVNKSIENSLICVDYNIM